MLEHFSSRETQNGGGEYPHCRKTGWRATDPPNGVGRRPPTRPLGTCVGRQRNASYHAYTIANVTFERDDEFRGNFSEIFLRGRQTRLDKISFYTKVPRNCRWITPCFIFRDKLRFFLNFILAVNITRFSLSKSEAFYVFVRRK